MPAFSGALDTSSIHHGKYRWELEPTILTGIFGLFAPFVQYMICTARLLCAPSMHKSKNRRERDSAIFTVEFWGHNYTTL